MGVATIAKYKILFGRPDMDFAKRFQEDYMLEDIYCRLRLIGRFMSRSIRCLQLAKWRFSCRWRHLKLLCPLSMHTGYRQQNTVATNRLLYPSSMHIRGRQQNTGGTNRLLYLLPVCTRGNKIIMKWERGVYLLLKLHSQGKFSKA